MALPAGEIQCPICMEPPENAVECAQCHNFFCEKCVNQLLVKCCPTCKLQPFKTQINVAIRRVVERLLVPCDFCGQIIPKGEMQIHLKNCAKKPKKCSVGNCLFVTNQEAEALTHFVIAHKEFILDNFESFPKPG